MKYLILNDSGVVGASDVNPDVIKYLNVIDESLVNRGEIAYFNVPGVLAIKNSENTGLIQFYSSLRIDYMFSLLEDTLTSMYNNFNTRISAIESELSKYYHQLTFILGNTIQLRVCFDSGRNESYDLSTFAQECLRRSVWSTNIIGRSGFSCQVIFNANNDVSKNVVNGTYYNGSWFFQTSDNLGLNSWKTISQVVPNEPEIFNLVSDDFYKIV